MKIENEYIDWNIKKTSNTYGGNKQNGSNEMSLFPCCFHISGEKAARSNVTFVLE